jgi:hypothetical protein
VKVRLTIDRVVLDGLELSPRERARILGDLRLSLTKAAMTRTADANPIARTTQRERTELSGAMRSGRVRLGAAIGKAVVEHVWTAGRHGAGVR